MLWRRDDATDDSLRLLEIFLPEDGWVVAFAEAYMDESYRKGSPYLTVAGYVFRRQPAREFAKRWGPYLNKAKGYPHFHMTDMIAKRDVFDRCEKPEADEIARKLIALTHKWTACGLAVTVDQTAYEAAVGGRWALPPNALGFALLQAMIMVRRWTNRVSFDGQVSYFFECGNEHQGEADRFLKELIAKSSQNRERYRYRLHAFLPKETHWLHPADMLAWHWSQEVQRREEAERKFPVRADLRALVNRPQDVTMHYSADQIARLQAELTSRYGAREPDWDTFNWDQFRRADGA